MMEKRNLKTSQYNEDIIEILKSTTIHGLNHVYSAKGHKSKICWLFLFILGIGGFSFNLTFIIRKYISNPILVSHFVNTERFMWPDLTFCNPTAPFALKANSSALEYWRKILKDTKHIVDAIPVLSNLTKFIRKDYDTENEFEEIAVSLSTADPSKLFNNEFQRYVNFFGFSRGHSDIYLVKEYDHFVTDLANGNYSELFSTKLVQIRQNVPCHTFQIEKSERINYTSLHSLKFYINLDLESYKSFNSSYTFRSLFLYITNKDYLPQTNEIMMMPGFGSEIKITQERFLRNDGKGFCRNDIYKVELYDVLLTSTNVFEGDFEDCRKVISQKLYVDKCQCYSPFLPIFRNQSGFPRLCFNASIFTQSEIIANANCISKVFETSSENGIFKQLEKQECEKFRKMKCNEIIYNSEVRTGIKLDVNLEEMNDRRANQLKSAFYKLFKENKSIEYIVKYLKQNMVVLSVKRASRYGDLRTEELEYSHSNLFSDIGGLMGLWLGLSVVGLFEIGGFAYFLTARLFTGGVQEIEKDKNDLQYEESSSFNIIT